MLSSNNNPIRVSAGFLLLALFVAACGSGQTAVRVGPVGMVLPDKSKALEEPEQIIPPDTFMVILRPGSFHGEDVPSLPKSGWTGLRFSNGKIELDSIEVITESVRDEMLDQEGEMSGISINSEPEGYQYLIYGLRSGSCALVSKNIPPIFPSKVEAFEYYGRTFELSAKAKNTGEEGDFNAVLDYRLELSTIINGRKEYQILASTYQFDDATMSILFIGDIDRDGWPDIVMDTSPKYSYSQITLFLSSEAEGKDIVKEVATFRATGC